MKLAALHTVTPTPTRPALEALQDHRNQLAEVAAADAERAALEAEELQHVAACGAAQAKVSTLEQRAVDAQADKQVYGRSDVDPDALADEITAAREAASTLIERGRLAEAKITRIRTQRAALREQRIKLAAQTRGFIHAARLERLGEAMATLVERESAYVAALQTAFGVAAAVDEVARQPGPALAMAGQMDLGELWLQRPGHFAYLDKPAPMKADIGRAIVAVAESVAKEL